MNRRLLGFAPLAMGFLLVGAAGCKGRGSLWLLLFAPNTTVDPECAAQVTHNFNDASEPTEEDTGFEPPLLTVTQELTQSESAMIAEVTGGSEPVLVIGSRLWIGVKDGSTTTFTWNAEETSTTTEGGLGYNYVVEYVIRIVESIKLDFQGNEATGTYKTTQESNQSWSETDAWTGKDVGVFGGQIPAYNYLVVDGKHGPVPATNTAEEVECGEANCDLALTSSCEVSVKVTATEIVAEEEDYDALGDASRPPGVPGGGDGGPPE